MIVYIHISQYDSLIGRQTQELSVKLLMESDTEDTEVIIKYRIVLDLRRLLGQEFPLLSKAIGQQVVANFMAFLAMLLSESLLVWPLSGEGW